jgi:hypothetical protein
LDQTLVFVVADEAAWLDHEVVVVLFLNHFVRLLLHEGEGTFAGGLFVRVYNVVIFR